jgi:site-specific DNA recombinase
MTRPLAIYVRVSRRGDRDDGRFHSPTEQVERARAHAASREYATDGVFEDINVSGAVHPQDRPAMARLLDAMDRGEVGGVVAFDLSRLSRDPGHGDWLVQRITAAGGIVTTPDMPDDVTSATGEFQFGIMLQVARLYRRASGERFARSKVRATKAGIPVGPTPLGYRRGEDRVMRLDKKKAPVVRDVFTRRAAGAGYTELAELLDARAPRPDGRLWSRQGVAAMLKVRTYMTGRLEYAGTVSEFEAGAIVDAPLWYAAQNVNGGTRRPRSQDPWMLTGLVVCGECNRRLAPVTTTTTAGTVLRRYRCNGRGCARENRGPKADALEQHVLSTMWLMGDTMTERRAAPDVQPLQDELDAAERRLAQAMTNEAQDALGDEWASYVRTQREARDEAARRVGTARVNAGDSIDVTRVREEWDDMSAEDRRRIVREYLVQAVIVNGNDASQWEVVLA